MTETAFIIQCLTGTCCYTAAAKNTSFRDDLYAVFFDFNGLRRTYLYTVETPAAFIVVDAYIAGSCIKRRQKALFFKCFRFH